jgi:hypothetical protein
VYPTLEGTENKIAELDTKVHTTVAAIANQLDEISLTATKDKIIYKLEHQISMRTSINKNTEVSYEQQLRTEETEVHHSLTERI